MESSGEQPEEKKIGFSAAVLTGRLRPALEWESCAVRGTRENVRHFPEWPTPQSSAGERIRAGPTLGDAELQLVSRTAVFPQSAQDSTSGSRTVHVCFSANIPNIREWNEERDLQSQ